jgi:23S rRNA (cytosine1962-C5)-methyltransferase
MTISAAGINAPLWSVVAFTPEARIDYFMSHGTRGKDDEFGGVAFSDTENLQKTVSSLASSTHCGGNGKLSTLEEYGMQNNVGSYELLDFGDGRKLERFGDVVLNRPCPTADGLDKSLPELWKDATARFRGPKVGDGSWAPAPRSWVPAEWQYIHDGAASFRLQLEPLPSGQVGVFPEQSDNWDWIAKECVRAKPPTAGGASLKVLNLFAYTGGSTLAAAATGAEVVHVDAAHASIDRARGNAELSGLKEAAIRWIPEDAMKFCQREVKRGNKYDAVILDPPSYGHGPKGEPWKIGEHLLPLLQLCGELTANSRAFVLVTCHSPGIGPSELSAYLADGIFGHCGEPAATGELYLQAADGRRLPSGVFARWPR